MTRKTAESGSKTSGKDIGLGALLEKGGTKLKRLLRRDQYASLLQEAGVFTLMGSIAREDLEQLTPVLVECLHESDLPLRAHALEILALFGPTGALGDLAGVLRDPDPVFRSRAARALGRLMSCPADGTALLLHALSDADANVSLEASNSLFRYDCSEQASRLVEVSRSIDPEKGGQGLLSNLALLLATLGDRAVPFLAAAARSPEVGAKAVATQACAFGEIGDRSIWQGVEGLESHSSATVRAGAALALALAYPDRASRLAMHLEEVVATLPPPLAKRAIELVCDAGEAGMSALPVILAHYRALYGGRPESVPIPRLGPNAIGPVLQALQSSAIPLLDAAVWTAQVGAPEAVEIMRRAFDDPALRAMAARVVGYVGAPAVAWTRTCRQDPKQPRHIVALMLASLQFAGPAALPALVEAVTDPDATIRVAAVRTIGDLSLPEGIAPAMPALADPDQTVRLSAACALLKLGEVERSGELLTRESGDDPVKVGRSISANRAPVNQAVATTILPPLISRLSGPGASGPLVDAVGALLGHAPAALRASAQGALHDLTGTWELRRTAVAITLKEEDPTRARLIAMRPQWAQN